MRLFFFCVLLILLPLSFAVGQKNYSNKFNEFYLKVEALLSGITNTDTAKAIDSLATLAQTDEERITVQLLFARLAQKEGALKDAIHFAMKADTIADASFNFYWKAKTAIFLGSSFRQLGLMKLSATYLADAETASEKENNLDKKKFLQVSILHEKAFANLALLDYYEANKDAVAAANYVREFARIDEETIIMQATNDLLLGLCNLRLGNLIEADFFLNEALRKVNSFENLLKPFVLVALADLAIIDGDAQKAAFFLNDLDSYVVLGNVRAVKIQTYDAWADYYQKFGSMALSIDNRTKALALKNQEVASIKKTLDDFIVNNEISNQEYRNKYLFAMGATVLVLLLVIFCIVMLFKQKEHFKKKSQALSATLAQQADALPTSKTGIHPALAKPESSAVKPARDINISKETESRLLHEFAKQEARLFFLEKGITVRQLASYMGTNARYVAYIVQKFRNKNFYDYVQCKRIEYIIDQFEKSPKLLDFKLSHLADMAGFVSLSKFSIAFKMVMGMPPSAFVHLLKKELEQDKV